MPPALANRFVHIDFSVDCEEWLEWAIKGGISPQIIAFLRFRPALLHDFDPEKDCKAFPSPRTWAFASNLIKSIRNNEDESVQHELLAGTIGVGSATGFKGFMKIWHELPKVEEIINTPDQVEIPTDQAVLFAVCEMVGRAAEQKTADKIMVFAGRLPEEFSVLLVWEAVRHCNNIAGTDSFAAWAARHADVLV
jgi:hypothetical protein